MIMVTETASIVAVAWQRRCLCLVSPGCWSLSAICRHDHDHRDLRHEWRCLVRTTMLVTVIYMSLVTYVAAMMIIMIYVIMIHCDVPSSLYHDYCHGNSQHHDIMMIMIHPPSAMIIINWSLK
jgi:hypothetical protein